MSQPKTMSNSDRVEVQSLESKIQTLKFSVQSVWILRLGSLKLRLSMRRDVRSENGFSLNSFLIFFAVEMLRLLRTASCRSSSGSIEPIEMY